MEILYLLIPVSLALAGLALGLFFWAVRAGQFDDLDTPPLRMLFDESPRPQPPGAHSPKEGPRADGAG